MKSLWRDEKGIAGAYIRILISVIMVSLVWIFLNEFVFRVGSATLGISTDPSFSGTESLLMYMWRFTPVVLLICSVIWGIWVAHRERPTYG